MGDAVVSNLVRCLDRLPRIDGGCDRALRHTPPISDQVPKIAVFRLHLSVHIPVHLQVRCRAVPHLELELFLELAIVGPSVRVHRVGVVGMVFVDVRCVLAGVVYPELGAVRRPHNPVTTQCDSIRHRPAARLRIVVMVEREHDECLLERVAIRFHVFLDERVR